MVLKCNMEILWNVLLFCLISFYLYPHDGYIHYELFRQFHCHYCMQNCEYGFLDSFHPIAWVDQNGMARRTTNVCYI